MRRFRDGESSQAVQIVAASYLSPIRRTVSKVATVGVQTDMSLDPNLDGLLVPVVVEIIPEYVDTESDIQDVDNESDSQASRPELHVSSDEDDEGIP